MGFGTVLDGDGEDVMTSALFMGHRTVKKEMERERDVSFIRLSLKTYISQSTPT